MFSYLIKVTIVWSILLLIYEALFQKSGRVTANRYYLLSGLLTGIFLPLIVLPFPDKVTQAESVQLLNNSLQIAAEQPAASAAVATEHSFSWIQALLLLYIGGAAWFLFLNLRAVIQILRQAVYGSYETIDGYRIFKSKGVHAPYSFMGWIFIAGTESYTEQELKYILQHEAAHNSRKHWIDMLLMQAIQVVFWFHPLVWRFRYLLRLQHEYEADLLAAGNDAYTYGHFLLQQTLLKGTPPIAHSFHFSPIKNRITMLTHRKSGGWKYLAVIPALFCCTLLTAKSTPGLQRIKKGNETSFKGNTFLWQPEISDTTTVVDPINGERTQVVTNMDSKIIGMNKDSVYYYPGTNNLQKATEIWGPFHDYLNDEFKKRVKDVPKNLMIIGVDKIVLDETGKIVYYETTYMASDSSGRLVNMAASMGSKYDKVIDELIEAGPHWQPLELNGKRVKSFIGIGPSLQFRALHFKATKRE